MADRPPPGHASPPADQPRSPLPGRASTTGSAQQLGFLALAVTLTAVLVLAGVTAAGALAALALLSPLLLLTAPLWVPVAVVVFLTGAASLLACCAGAAAATWAHRYYFAAGRHRRARAEEPDGAVSARAAAVAEVAGRVRGYYAAYAREHGAYPRPHARVKDAAPGA